MMKKARHMFMLFFIFSLVVSSVGTALAADDDDSSSGNGLKLTTNTFTKDASWSQVEPWMPLAGLVIVILLFLYVISLFSGQIVSGMKINFAALTKSNDLRTEGQKGILHTAGGLFLMCVFFVAIFILWNEYGPGTW